MQEQILLIAATDDYALYLITKDGGLWIELVDNKAGKVWLMSCHTKDIGRKLFNTDFIHVKKIMERMGVQPTNINE